MADSVDLKSLGIGNRTTILNISTTATALPTIALPGRKSIIIQNLNASNTLYVGNASITATENSDGGWQLANRYDDVSLDFDDNNIVYGIVSAGTLKLGIWEGR